MVKRWINYVIFVGYFYIVLTHNCESDEDCTDGKICRMICKRTCSATCVSINNLKNKHSKENKSSSEEPFAVETNPFDTLQRDDTNIVTPLTISESELEAELKQSNFDATTLPPTFTNPTTSFPTPPTPLPEFTTTIIPVEASSPGQVPHPPGIEQHESGYMPIPENITTADATTTVFPPTTVLSNFIEPSFGGGGGGYDKGVDEFQIESFNNNEATESTLPVSEATMFTESSISSFPFETATNTFNNALPVTDINTVTENIKNNSIEETLPNAVQGIPIEDPNNIGCLPPQICEKNCGIFVDSNGCQICQCLWLSIPCEVSSDCVEEGQFCDLGRCECMPGYVQDMLQSGICKPAETEHIDLQNIAEVHSNSSTATTETRPTNSQNEKYPQNRRSKRSQTSEKPQRMERLQWPGVLPFF